MYTARVITADASPQAEPSASQQQRYRIEQSDRWTKVIDCETGEKVGASIRGANDEARAEAEARIHDLTTE